MFFLGVSVLSEDDDIKFSEAYTITFPVGKENGIGRMLGVMGIPLTVFISREGKITKKFIGDISYAELTANIRAMLK